MIIGNLTADAETKSLEKSLVALFSVAENHSYTKSDGTKVDEVEYFNCEQFLKTESKLPEFLKKGTLVAVSGRITTQKWEDANDGTKKSRQVVRVEDLKLLGSK